MARNPDGTCPDCGTDTEILFQKEWGKSKLFDALCDGCAADRAVEKEYRGTDY